MGEPNKKTQLPPLTESLLLQMLKSKDRKYFITEFDFSKYNIGLIANNLFENCNKLESVTLPDSVTKIGQDAFRNCSKLSSLNMPKSLEVIEPHAFEGCTSLSSIPNRQPFVIPSNVKEIGEDAFKKVHWIHYEGSVNLSKCGAIKVTTKPEELPNNASNGQEYNLEDVLNNSSADEGETASKEQKKNWLEKGIDFFKGKKPDTKQESTPSQLTRQQTNQPTVQSPTSQPSPTQYSPSKSSAADQQQTNTLEQLSDQLSSARAEIVVLKKEKIALETQYKIQQESLLNEANKQIEEANGEAQKYLDEYNKIKKEYDGYVAEAENELNEKEQKITNLQGQITTKQTTIDNKEQEIKNKQSEIDKLEKDLKASRAIAPVISPIMENFIGKLVDVIDKKANTIAEVKAFEQTTNLAKILANGEKQRLDREIVDKTKELDNLKEQAKNKEEELKQQFTETKRLLEDKQRTLEGEIKEKEKDISLKEGTISELSKQVAEEQGKVQKLEADKTKLESDKTKLQTDNKTLYDNNVILGQKNDEKKTKITSLTAQLEQLQKKYDEDIAKKEEELQASLSNSNEASAKLLEDQKAKFDEEISKYKSEFEEEKSRLKSDNQNLFNANNELKEQKEKVAKDLESHQSLYADFDNLYKDYKSLPEGVKITLQSLFGKDDSVVSIVFNITKSRNIEAFWQFICDRIDKNELPEQIEKLKNIFAIAFKLLQVADINYVLLEPNIGDVMNNITMRRHSKSPQVGSVKEVFFKGIKYQANNRIIKQSLVLLG